MYICDHDFDARSVTAVGCTDCSLLVFNEAGARSLPSIMLPGKPACVWVQGSLVLAATNTGALYLWNVQKKQCLIKNEQISGIVPVKGMIRLTV